MQNAVAEQEITPPAAPEAQPESVVDPVETTEEQADKPHEEKPRDESGRFKRSAQDRINEITRAKHDAEREAEFWRQKATAKPESPADKPAPDQYKDYGEFVEALADWKADQRVSAALAARDGERAKDAEGRAAKAGTDAWQERQTAVRGTIADYDEVIGKSQIVVAPHVITALLDSEHGPEVAYHLAKHPDQADRINGLSPLSAAREIGRLEASLSAPKQPIVKPASNAPAPISPVRNSASQANDPAQMTHEQYRQMRAKQGARWSR